jgi:Fic family protein
MYGADVQAVRTLSRHLHDASSQIEGLSRQLTNLLGSTQWEGPDASSFRNDWTSHQSALNNVVSSLNSASQAAQRNADQQEQASGA